MLILCRSVRFAINPPDHPGDQALSTDLPGANGYGGIPALRGLGRYFEFNVECRGEVDRETGYLVDIKAIDRAVRAQVLPRLADACATDPSADPASLLPDLFRALRCEEPRCTSLRLALSPYHSVEMTSPAPQPSEAPPPAAPPAVLLRQKFDFAASHRLHIPSLSDAENLALFGKCNNAAGHGHNYQFEPCIAIPAQGDAPFTLVDLERLAQASIIDRFDHKNLNVDTSEFNTERGGLNPTVENIAKVFHDLFAAALAESGTTARLHTMTVWETDRTSATYPAR